MNPRHLLLLIAGALSLFVSCRNSGREEDSWRELLARSEEFSARQEWEQATEYAIKALSAGDITKGGRSLALSRLAALDIITWRDAQGWEHAVEAERLARADGTDSLIASALLQKARLQLCGAITEGEAQDAATIRARCDELLGGENDSVAEDIASYISHLAEERSRRVKELGLTARELEVIRLSAEGLSAAGIAERLHVSVYTIKNHKQNIYLKMGVGGNVEMLRLANELEIV